MAPKGRKELTGKSALITGGARNIGLAIARELAGQGASIALIDICRDLPTIPYALSGPLELEAAVQEIGRFGVKVLGLTCDIRKERQVKKAMGQVRDAFGRLDMLINNAGVVSLQPITGLSEKAWDVVLDVCLKGTYLCCKHALPMMIEQHNGKIVNIASIAGLKGLGLGVHYCAAKHGVVGLTKALAIEVADHNINVNALCPGTTESPMLEGLAAQIQLKGSPYKHFAQDHLFQDRSLTPQDIAQAVCWLVSEKSRAMTGTIMTIDAGWSAR